MRAGKRLGVAGRAAARGLVTDGVVRALERLDRSRAGLFAILMYHRIAEASETPERDPALVSASPRVFAEQMASLAATRPVIGLDRLLAAKRGDAQLPAGAVLLTFDDAYADFDTHAWPVLRRLGLPVTLFVPTAYPGDPLRSFWWDTLHAALSADAVAAVETPFGRLPLATPDERARTRTVLRERLAELPHHEAVAFVERLAGELGTSAPPAAVLSWDELRRLAREGVTLAPHTRTHPLLSRVPLEVARDEIQGSMRDLGRELASAAPPVLAYPGGGYSDDVARAAADAGIEIALTTERGLNDLRRPDWLRLRRINVGRRSTTTIIRMQLLGWTTGRRPGAVAAGVGGP